MRARLALVPGEPAGIGPELCVRLAHRGCAAHLVAFADPDTLLAAAQAIGLPLRLREPGPSPAARVSWRCSPCRRPAPPASAQADPANAAAVVRPCTTPAPPA